MLSVKAGPELVLAVERCFNADVPLMCHGRHGAGKSALLLQAAAVLGIDVRVRDLSLMEPPDLLGIPTVGSDGRTHYAAPSFLPTGGRGLFVIEEINRAPRFMQAPCLQLLTARELGDYRLPPGWLPVAAVNDASDGYIVDELDAALHSRFVHLRVVPDVEAWLSWARDNSIHGDVISFVEQSPGVFDEPSSNPRAWAMVSQILSAKGHDGLLPALVAGIVGDTWAEAFLAARGAVLKPLTHKEIIDRYSSRRAALCRAVAERKLDVVKASMAALQRYLQRQANYSETVADAARKTNVVAFLADLPAELRRTIKGWLDERGYAELSAACEKP
jgi:MoxR-like ATPase